MNIRFFDRQPRYQSPAEMQNAREDLQRVLDRLHIDSKALWLYLLGRVRGEAITRWQVLKMGELGGWTEKPTPQGNLLIPPKFRARF